MAEIAENSTPGERLLPVSIGTLGMWLFLSTEAMLFAAIFSVWFVLRQSAGPEWPDRAIVHVDFWSGLFNTLVLLGSGLTAAMAAIAAEAGRTRMARSWIVVTLGLGAIFLGIKAGEFMVKERHGLIAVDGTRGLRDHADAAYLSSVQSAVKSRLAPESPLNDFDRERLQSIQLGIVNWSAMRAGQATDAGERELQYRSLAQWIYPCGAGGPERQFVQNDAIAARLQKSGLLLKRDKAQRRLSQLQAILEEGKSSPDTGLSAKADELSQAKAAASAVTLELAALNNELVPIESRLSALEQFGPALAGEGLNGEFGFRLPVAIPGCRMWSATWLLMTGMHALHMLAGMAGWAWVLMSNEKLFSAVVSNLTRYWHFVDAVWLVIFAIIYCL